MLLNKKGTTLDDWGKFQPHPHCKRFTIGKVDTRGEKNPKNKKQKSVAGEPFANTLDLKCVFSQKALKT